MDKNFDDWNLLKKRLDNKVVQRNLFFYEREIWWCSAGINVGVEINGKNQNYERPFLIIKKFNSQMVWAIPITSKDRFDNFHQLIKTEGKTFNVCLSQIKTMSTKRLLRKITTISTNDFIEINTRIFSYIKTNTAG